RRSRFTCRRSAMRSRRWRSTRRRPDAAAGRLRNRKEGMMAYDYELDERPPRGALSPTERALCFVGAAALLMYGLRRESSATRLATVAAAALAAFEGLSGRMPGARLLGFGGGQDEGAADAGTIYVTETV